MRSDASPPMATPIASRSQNQAAGPAAALPDMAAYFEPDWPTRYPDVRPFIAVRDVNRQISSQTFRYFIDGRGVIWLPEVPDDLGRYYDSSYHYIPGSVNEYERFVAFENYKVELIRPWKQCGRLLEVGSSFGSFCYAAKRAGFDVSAIEMSGDCCQTLRSLLGVNAMQDDDPARVLARDPTDYDVIVMWHSLEHMTNPLQVLKAAAERLAPGGILAIAMPNPDAFQFRLLGKNWTHVDAPRHLFLFPASFMRQAGRFLGLETVLLTTRDKGSLNWNDFGWRMSIGNFGVSPVSRKLLRGVGKVVARALAPIEGREGSGSAYTVIYRKPLNQ